MVIGQEGEDPAGYPDGKIEGELIQLLYDAQGGHGLCAVPGDETGLGGDGDHGQGVLDGGGKAGGEDRAQVAQRPGKQGGIQAHRGLSPPDPDIEQKIQGGGQVGQGGGHARAHGSEAEKGGKDEKGIQKDIQDAAHGDADGGGGRVAFRPHQVRQEGVQDRGRAADHHRPQRVAEGRIVDVRTGAAQSQHRAGERQKEQGKQDGKEQPAPEGKGGDLPGRFPLFRSQRPGEGAGAAHAEQVGDRREHHEGRIDHRDGRRLAGLVEHSHEIRVRQAVDQSDHLSGHGRNHLPEYRPPDGHGFE